MRILCGLFLGLSAVALSGCVSDTYDQLTYLKTGCTATSFQVNCGSALTSTGTKPKPQTTTTTGTKTTTADTVNTGNTAGFTTGDTTVILEGSTVLTNAGDKPGLSQLTQSPFAHLIGPATNSSGVVDPKVLEASTKISFNTNENSNGAWPVPKTMVYNEYGTCQVYNPSTRLYENHVDPSRPGQCDFGTGGIGLGGDYKLYRYYKKNGFDEELQLWTWKDAYATQYRDVTVSGTDPQHQAWSFGGNYTPATDMATLKTSNAIVNYTGTFTATAKTSNYADVPRATKYGQNTNVTGSGKSVSRNGSWRVVGSSALKADFGTGDFTGRLTSEYWTTLDDSKTPYTVDVKAAQAHNADCFNLSGTCDPSDTTGAGGAQYTNWQNYTDDYMASDVVLAGTILSYDKTKPDKFTTATKQNQIVGTAEMDQTKGWITTDGTNPMYGGFFGAGGKEVAGAFGLDAAQPDPVDGTSAINNDTRAYIQMSGIFHGTAP